MTIRSKVLISLHKLQRGCGNFSKSRVARKLLTLSSEEAKKLTKWLSVFTCVNHGKEMGLNVLTLMTISLKQ